MLTGTFTVRTAADPHEVERYLADFRHQAEWRDDVLESTLESGEPGADAAVYRQRVHEGPRTTSRQIQARVGGEGRHIEFHTLDTTLVRASGSYAIAPADGGGTTIECVTNLDFSGIGNVLRPIVRRELDRRMQVYPEALASRLDQLARHENA